MANNNVFWNKEQQCEFTFQSGGPYWHVCTPGVSTEILFVEDDDYRRCLTIIGFAASHYPLKILACVVMSNHIHLIVEGHNGDCVKMIDEIRSLLKRYLNGLGRNAKMSSFKCTDPIEISSLQMIRNEIVYVNRNRYVIDPDTLPYTDKWGSSCFFFNPLNRSGAVPLSLLTFREKRALLKTRVEDMPASYCVRDGMLDPASFCDISRAEAFFRDAHHYFALLTRNYEAYSEAAKRLGDTICLTDEEMYPAICALCEQQFHVNSPKLLPPEDKLELAKEMHNRYHASNGQIRRILKLEMNVIEELFPTQVIKKV